jgi:hypothetical protein
MRHPPRHLHLGQGPHCKDRPAARVIAPSDMTVGLTTRCPTSASLDLVGRTGRPSTTMPPRNRCVRGHVQQAANSAVGEQVLGERQGRHRPLRARARPSDSRCHKGRQQYALPPHSLRSGNRSVLHHVRDPKTTPCRPSAHCDTRDHGGRASTSSAPADMKLVVAARVVNRTANETSYRIS